MKPSKQQKRTRWTRFLMKMVLVVVSTALVVYFMPRGDEFGYKYGETDYRGVAYNVIQYIQEHLDELY